MFKKFLVVYDRRSVQKAVEVINSNRTESQRPVSFSELTEVVESVAKDTLQQSDSLPYFRGIHFIFDVIEEDVEEGVFVINCTLALDLTDPAKKLDYAIDLTSEANALVESIKSPIDDFLAELEQAITPNGNGGGQLH